VRASIGARALTLYKEVDGLMTPTQERAGRARHRETALPRSGELAYYGAKVLHPRTMIRSSTGESPLFVRNRFARPAATRIAAM